MEQNTALLVMDVQAGIVSMLPDATALLNNINKALAHARKNGIPVIYVVVGFRNGLPEVSANSSKTFAGMKDRLGSVNMADFMAVHQDIQPQDGEVVVIKKRVSAFTGSDLEVILRSYGIKHMVLSGISTSGVVLSTVREAADKDYQLTVLSDCCADNEAESHQVLLTKVFPRQAEVLTVDEWTK